jgi:hypothetical protein
MGVGNKVSETHFKGKQWGIAVCLSSQVLQQEAKKKKGGSWWFKLTCAKNKTLSPK